MLLDFKIKKETNNQKSLDDVMRFLYKKYYQEKGRGFTDAEFQEACETIAGTSLVSEFEYVSSTKEFDYQKYLDYAGLEIDTTSYEKPGGWLGISTRNRNDTLIVTSVEWKSPAWNAGIRPGNMIFSIDNQTPPTISIENVLSDRRPGDSIHLKLRQKEADIEADVTLGIKKEKSFEITRAANSNKQAQEILASWLSSN